MKNLKDIIQSMLSAFYLFLHNQARFVRTKELLRDGRLVIGSHSYGIPVVDIYEGNKDSVIIGSYCSIAKNVTMILGGIHPPNWVSLYPFRIKFGLPGAYTDGMPMTKGNIEIGSDVWIGTDVMILSGVKIGHGAVVAARSVVSKDVPPFSIVAGVPAKVIKYRFNEEQILSMQAIKWWEWNEAEIMKAIPLLSSPDINDFILTYGRR